MTTDSARYLRHTRTGIVFTRETAQRLVDAGFAKANEFVPNQTPPPRTVDK